MIRVTPHRVGQWLPLCRLSVGLRVPLHFTPAPQETPDPSVCNAQPRSLPGADPLGSTVLLPEEPQHQRQPSTQLPSLSSLQTSRTFQHL